MKQIKCEMCGSTSFVKQDGMFTCQHCGVQYSVEEAKKMMVEIEGTVNVEGTVKIDSSNELKNLYELARRAKNNNDSDSAQRYYEQIAVKDPSSWEANFYSVYYRSMNCKIAGIRSAAYDVANCEKSIIDLILNNVNDLEEQKKAFIEVGSSLKIIAEMMFDSYAKHFIQMDGSIKGDHYPELNANSIASINIVETYANLIEGILDGQMVSAICVPLWKFAINKRAYLQEFIKYLKPYNEENVNGVQTLAEKIKKYEPSYETPSVQTASSAGPVLLVFLIIIVVIIAIIAPLL